ncbi:MAG: hypothetical protein MUC74_00835 [Ideonella sp.]|nr:hypothetical protein [Ideonella sp.]
MVDRPAGAEAGDAHRAAVVDKHVVQLHVAMSRRRVVPIGQTFEHGAQPDADIGGRRRRVGGQPLAQREALRPVIRDEGPALLDAQVGRHRKVWVTQTRGTHGA